MENDDDKLKEEKIALKSWPPYRIVLVALAGVVAWLVIIRAALRLYW